MEGDGGSKDQRGIETANETEKYCVLIIYWQLMCLYCNVLVFELFIDLYCAYNVMLCSICFVECDCC